MISRKTCYWIIGILLFFIVILITKDFGSNKDLVSYIGFAGTLISIILAIIAIIYSFYQSSVYDSSTRSLNESTIRIKKLVKEVNISFNKLSNSIENIEELKVITKSLENSIKGIEEVSCDIQGGVNETRRTVEDIKSRVKLFDSINQNNSDINSNKIIYTEEQIKNIMLNFSQVHKMILYLVFKSHMDKKEFGLEAFVDYYLNELVSKNGKENKFAIQALFLGIITSFNSFNILNINIQQIDDDTKIKVLDHSYDKNIEGIFKNLDCMHDNIMPSKSIDDFIEKQ